MTTNRNIPALTSLRFFAAAAIFALHTAELPNYPTGDFFGFTLNHGVSFFYVLSGFILHYNYRNKLDYLSFGKFVFLRFARIWPLHVVVLAACGLIFWSDLLSWYRAYLSPGALASIIFLLHAWSTDNNVYFAINGVSWSISVEMFFYVCFIPLAFGVRKHPFLTTSAYLLLLATYIVCIWETPSLHHLSDAFFSKNPFFRLFDFVAGILAAELIFRKASGQYRTSTWTIIEFASISAVLISNYLNSFFFVEFPNTYPPLKMLAYTSLTDPAFAIMICVFATSSGWFSRALSVKPLVLLGQWSFAIYLVHQPIQKYIGIHFSDSNEWFLLTLSAATTVVVSAFCHHWIELPAYDAAKRMVGRKKPDQGIERTAPV